MSIYIEYNCLHCMSQCATPVCNETKYPTDGDTTYDIIQQVYFPSQGTQQMCLMTYTVEYDLFYTMNCDYYSNCINKGFCIDSPIVSVFFNCSAVHEQDGQHSPFPILCLEQTYNAQILSRCNVKTCCTIKEQITMNNIYN